MTMVPATGLAASVSGLAFEPAGQWQEELAELQRRRGFAQAMGGPEALARFRAKGLLNARERIARLLDADSFRVTLPSRHVHGLLRVG